MEIRLSALLEKLKGLKGWGWGLFGADRLEVDFGMKNAGVEFQMRVRLADEVLRLGIEGIYLGLIWWGEDGGIECGRYCFEGL